MSFWACTSQAWAASHSDWVWSWRPSRPVQRTLAAIWICSWSQTVWTQAAKWTYSRRTPSRVWSRSWTWQNSIWPCWNTWTALRLYRNWRVSILDWERVAHYSMSSRLSVWLWTRQSSCQSILKARNSGRVAGNLDRSFRKTHDKWTLLRIIREPVEVEITVSVQMCDWRRYDRSVGVQFDVVRIKTVVTRCPLSEINTESSRIPRENSLYTHWTDGHPVCIHRWPEVLSIRWRCL